MLSFSGSDRCFVSLFFCLVIVLSASAWSKPLASDSSFLIKVSSNPEEEEFAHKVQKFIDVGRFQKASSLLKTSSNLYQSPYLFLQLLLCDSFAGDGDALAFESEKWLSSNTSASNEYQALVYAFAGLGYEWKKEYERALELYAKSVELEPRWVSYDAKRALAALIVNNVKDKSGVRVFPEKERSRLQEIIMLRASQITYSFIETPVEYSSIVDSNLRKVLLDAEAQENDGHLDMACSLYKRAAENSHFSALMWNQYALCLLTKLRQVEDTSKGKSQDLIHVVPGSSPEAVSSQVDKIFAQAVRSATRKPREDVSEAENYLRSSELALRKAIRLNDGDWRLWNNLGMLEVILNDELGYEQSFRMALSYKSLPSGQREAIRRSTSIHRALMRFRKNRFNEQFGEGETDSE